MQIYVMEQEETTKGATTETMKAVDDAAKLIEKHGAETIFTSLWVVLIATVIGLATWYAYRRLSGTYIHKNDVLKVAKEEHPNLFKKDISELPDLRSHEVFTTWQKELREASIIVIHDSDGSENKSKTDLARDIISWSIRGYRDTVKGLLTCAYEDKDGFENYFGNQKECLSILENTYLDANEGIRVRLVEELGFPLEMWEKLSRFRNKHHELMNKMFALAVNNHDTNYWRINEILNSYYAAAESMSDGIIACVTQVNDVYSYNRSPDAAMVTRNNNRMTASYAPRIFEGKYNPKSR